MCYNTFNNKRIIFIAVFFLLIFSFFSIPTKECVYAESEDLMVELDNNTNEILNDIDSSELDEFLNNDFTVSYWSFKDFVVDVLDGKYLTDYNSIFNFLKSSLSHNIKSNLRFFILFWFGKS